MFEDYLQDAYEFVLLAKKAATVPNEKIAKRYFRAAVFCAASGLESFINYIADSFAKAGTLTKHEIAFLNDKAIIYSIDKKEVIERVEFHRLEDKLKLLFHKFEPGFDFRTPFWAQVLEFKDLRDSLVHPRKTEDEIGIADYDKRLLRGISATIQLMDQLSYSIFKKHLRPQILDLKPE